MGLTSVNSELPPHPLRPLFHPQSVAIIGASTKPNKIGGRPIAFLKRGGYRGSIYPINPFSEEVQGLRAYASVSDVEGKIDQAIIALPAEQVMTALEDCIAKEIPVVQIFSAGFAEVSEQGRVAQENIAARASAAGVRLLGPNTLGVFNTTAGFFGTFAVGLDGAWPAAGNVGIASQSGAFGSYLFALAEARGLRFSSFVATGNECDVDVAECVGYLAQDEATQVIIATLESCRDGSRLIAALREAHRAAKPVIVMKVGASEQGAAAVTTHTGSLAGADAVYDAVFRQHHAFRARSIDELLDLAYLCAQGVLPPDDRVGILTTSGGIGVLMADTAAESDLRLPSLSDETRSHLQEIWPYTVGDNPVDTTAQLIVDLPRFAALLEAMLQGEAFGTLVGFLAHVGRKRALFDQLREPLLTVRRRYPEKLFVLSMLSDNQLQSELEADGFLVFSEPARAIHAIGAAARLARGFAAEPSAAPGVVPASPVPWSSPPDELEANRMLAAAGIPMVPAQMATSREETAEAAGDLGFPVALKILSPDIQHKTDAGGVLLNVPSEEAARDGFEQLYANARKHLPAARLEGVLVTPMIEDGVECIFGVQRDPVFGPVVMFGLGGVFVELFRDVTFRVAPFSEAEALGMIEETKAAASLRGARGRPPADLAALARALAALSRFAYAHRDSIEGVDINPMIALPDRVVGVDALIHPLDQESGSGRVGYRDRQEPLSKEGAT